MTDHAVRYVRSGDGQVAFRVVGSGPWVAWVPGTIAVRRHDRDGSRGFVAGRTPWSRSGASATVMRSKRRGAAAPPEGG